MIFHYVPELIDQYISPLTIPSYADDIVNYSSRKWTGKILLFILDICFSAYNPVCEENTDNTFSVGYFTGKHLIDQLGHRIFLCGNKLILVGAALSFIQTDSRIQVQDFI